MNTGERNQVAVAYVNAFLQHGSRAYVGNLDTTVGLHHWGEHALPTTVNDGTPAGTFVCSPTIGYVSYPLEELAHFPRPALVPALRALIRGIGAIVAPAAIDRVVHVNNWMLSTNLPVPLDPALARSETAALVAQYPTHLLAIRSLTRHYNAKLITALEAAGWVLLASRQVYLIDDVETDTWRRRDTKRDHQLWQRGDFTYEELAAASDADAARITELYAMLYLEKYSRLNPAYTARFVALTHTLGVIRYLVLRDRDGTIQAFGGMHRSGEFGTMPMIGYNTALDQELGLYRRAFHAGILQARQHRLRFNMSSGATSFKRNRGARAEMEFTAFYVRHLSWRRRYPFGILRAVASRVAVPLMQKYHL